ncbi:DUF309 domain-containing protein [Herbidospora mongoliensis]|uniref:DUF309 domain-containing protein n=1 Tax=Herbidospora mongoliensis TaxID=688067 RepID=UPI0009FBE2FE|nr:DUF309 domain-containing protein [Herbidospora mongoliensis]
MTRDRDPAGRARNARPRDAYGRPLPHDAEGVERVPDDYAPTAEQAITDGVEMLRLDRPFHAHEIFEGRWKNCPPEERELWQGLAQLCVGLTHLQRGNERGAETLLERGTGRLKTITNRPYGIDAAAAAQARSINDLLAALGATSIGT